MFALVAGACLIKEKVLGELGLQKLRVVLLIAGVYHVGHGAYYARVMEYTMHDGEPLNHIRLPQGWTSGTPTDKAMALAER